MYSPYFSYESYAIARKYGWFVLLSITIIMIFILRTHFSLLPYELKYSIFISLAAISQKKIILRNALWHSILYKHISYNNGPVIGGKGKKGEKSVTTRRSRNVRVVAVAGLHCWFDVWTQNPPRQFFISKWLWACLSSLYVQWASTQYATRPTLIQNELKH